MGSGVSGLNGKSGNYDSSVRGTNDVKTTGKSEYWEGINRTPGSYEIMYQENGETYRKRVNGYLVEQSGRLFGFTDTTGEDGYTITDIKTGMAIGKTHPKTDYIGIGKSRTLTGKSGYAVKDELLLFGDKMARDGFKSSLNAREYIFDNTKRKRK